MSVIWQEMSAEQMRMWNVEYLSGSTHNFLPLYADIFEHFEQQVVALVACKMWH